MIINLFSIFDPVSSWYLPNWVSFFFFLFFYPLYKWLPNNRIKKRVLLLKVYILNEFLPLLYKRGNSLLFILGVFIFVVVNNFIGLFPYIFTASRHLSFTISLSLTLWIRLIIYTLIINISNILIHLIPQGTPIILIPFIVVIETISNLIRPLTLGVRLRANMIAGHLLLVLVRTSVLSVPMLIPISFLVLIILIFLELAVALIQAYVIRILITLYIREAIK